MKDLDYYRIDDVEDCDDERVHVLIFDNTTSSYAWHWVSRETFAENDRHNLANYGMEHAE